jgi:hypothetical protein
MNFAVDRFGSWFRWRRYIYHLFQSYF